MTIIKIGHNGHTRKISHEGEPPTWEWLSTKISELYKIPKDDVAVSTIAAASARSNSLLTQLCFHSSRISTLRTIKSPSARRMSSMTTLLPLFDQGRLHASQYKEFPVPLSSKFPKTQMANIPKKLPKSQHLRMTGKTWRPFRITLSRIHLDLMERGGTSMTSMVNLTSLSLMPVP